MHLYTTSFTGPIHRAGSSHKLQVVSSGFLSNIRKVEALRSILIVRLICLAIRFSVKIMMAEVGNTILEDFRFHCSSCSLCTKYIK